MHHINIYTAQSSPRLKYVLDWLMVERLGCTYALVHKPLRLPEWEYIELSYGAATPGCISIPDTGLMWEKGIHRLGIQKGIWENIPIIFSVPEEGYTVPFDLFSAIFFLLSRYEEYYAYSPDKHGRYPATASILYNEGWLLRPLVDEWVSAFRKLMLVAGLQHPEPEFTFLPTYDIDIAFAHLHKGFVRTAGAYLRNLIKGDIVEIISRALTLTHRQEDPYYSFEWMHRLHQKYKWRPMCFILCALKTTAFDKNTHPLHPAMWELIMNLAMEYDIGMHPSYYSENDTVFDSEKSVLERTACKPINVSRQHYIKFTLPDTYRTLLSRGIFSDYSMGYGTHLGFRAGTGSSFLWFDMECNQCTKLRIHPFCFMDSTAHFEEQLTAQEAFSKLNALARILRDCSSGLITVFHNFSLGTDPEWAGWREAYEKFMQEMARS